MLTGISGIAYQLLRLHPDCDLPSVLTFGEAGRRPRNKYVMLLIMRDVNICARERR